MNHRRLWIAFSLVVAGSFAVLGFFGAEIYRKAPPIPERIVTADGHFVATGQEIRDGQNVWQSTGGQELGTVWGHGSYVAPDWTADWLHREASFILDRWAMDERGAAFGDLDDERQAALQARLRGELRSNTYDAETGDLVISRLRAEAYASNADYYAGLFGGDPRLDELREAYAMKAVTVADPGRLDRLSAFFFCSSSSRFVAYVLGVRHRAARHGNHVHQQLAARRAGGQPGDTQPDPVDPHESGSLRRTAVRRPRAGVVLRGGGSTRDPAAGSGS